MALKPMLFIDSLCMRPARTKEEIREMVAKSIWMEDMRDFHKLHMQYEASTREKKEGKKRVYGEGKMDESRSKDLPEQRFH